MEACVLFDMDRFGFLATWLLGWLFLADRQKVTLIGNIFVDVSMVEV